MKAILVNSSPHLNEGLTATIARPFMEGMTDAGAEVEVVYTKKLALGHCTGCFSCWGRTPGECIIEDDVNVVLKKLADAERWVFASPIYSDGINAAIKVILERLIVTVSPVIEMKDGHTRHKLLDGVKESAVALIASCGMWEIDQFDPAIAQVEAFCGNFSRQFAGSLLRPHSQALRTMRDAGAMNDIFAAARNAGRTFVTNATILPRDAAAVSRELMTSPEYVSFFNKLIGEGAAKTQWNMKKRGAATPAA